MKGFFRRRLLEPVLSQLKQGISPSKIALSMALGITLGIFPIIGSTTLLCLAAGAAFRLNHPTLQAVNYAVAPLQVALVAAFVRVGERLFDAVPLPFSASRLVAEFQLGPWAFMQKFWLAGLHGIVAWTLVAPFLAAALYAAFLPLLNRIAARGGRV